MGFRVGGLVWEGSEVYKDWGIKWGEGEGFRYWEGVSRK